MLPIINEDKGKKIAIFGAGNVARAVIITIRETIGFDNINFIGCIVTNAKRNVQKIEGIEVHSIEEISSKDKDALVLIATRERFYEDIQKVLEAHEMSNYRKVQLEDCIEAIEDCWLKNAGNRAQEFINHLNRKEISDENYLMFLSKQLKRNQFNFEVNVADHCNLNCQCCNHFSPLAETHFLDIVQYERDIFKLNELFGENIGRLMLLGGEPLLNPQLIEIMKLSRSYLKTALICVYTNGLLLPQMTDEFWKCCRDQQIHIRVTKYPVNFDYAYWEKFAAARGVNLSDENPEPIKVTYWMPFSVEGNLDPFKNYMSCYHANQCVVLRDGRIYTCPNAAWVDILNKYYNKEFPQMEQNSIDIHKISDKNAIENFLKNPIKLCEYCNISNYKYNIPWGVSKRNIREWIE